MQDFKAEMWGKQHTFQLSLDVPNVGNLLNPDWGVRTIAGSAAQAPLTGEAADLY